MIQTYDHASLEVSKRLIEVGIVLETETYWYRNDNLFHLITKEDLWCIHYNQGEYIPAPSVVELWRELPATFPSRKDIYKRDFVLRHEKERETKDAGIVGYFIDGIRRQYRVYGVGNNPLKTPADALAELLIWVRSQKLDVDCLREEIV